MTIPKQVVRQTRKSLVYYGIVLRKSTMYDCTSIKPQRIGELATATEILRLDSKYMQTPLGNPLYQLIDRPLRNITTSYYKYCV